MLNNIESKPTTFNGITYRSKLESMWAEFFTDVGIKFKYEPNKYKLPKMNYIPDFWIYELKKFAEVKPTNFNENEQYKVEELCKLTKKPILKLIGIPPSTRISKEAWIKLYEEVFLNDNKLKNKIFTFTRYQEDDFYNSRFVGFENCNHSDIRKNRSGTRVYCNNCSRILIDKGVYLNTLRTKLNGEDMIIVENIVGDIKCN